MSQSLRPRRRAVLACLVAAVAGCASSAASRTEVAAARHDALEILRSCGSPALSVAVVEDGRLAWEAAFGLATVTPGREAATDSVFRIGSLSKLLTATTLVRLAERGAVSLDDPVSRWLGSFADPRVTLRQLAQHLGGVRHYGRSEYVNTRHYASLAEAVASISREPLVAAPGEKYLYSSYGYNLLGAALEGATRTRFPDLVTREVLRPFGMRDTFAGAREDDARVVTFYGRDGDGAVVEETPVDLSDRLPSGGYLSTAPDLARFVIGVLRSPEREQSLLFTPGRTADGASTNVGLAFRVAVDGRGRRYVHHGGDTVGGRAFLLAYPKERVAVVLLANLTFARLGEGDARRIAERFLP